MSLLLPSNRHCYKLSISAPLGYVFTVLARLRSSSAENSDSPAKGLQSINILFGDSNHILTNGISTCPLMIRYYANQVISSMVSIGTHLEALVSLNESRNHQIIESINNNQMKPDKASTSGSLISSLELDELEYKTLENLENKQRELKELLAIWPNLKLFKPILLSILQSLIGDNGTADMNFAWRILQMDYTTVNPFKVFYGHDTISNPPPATITKQKSKASGSRGEKTVQPVKANTVEETFINRWSKPVDPNILIAVVRIQSLFRGHRIRSATLLNQTRFIVETLSSTNSQSDTENTETKSKFFMRKILLRKIKRLTNGWMNCLNILQQGHNQYEVGNELIQRLILSNSSVVNNCAIQTRLIEDLNLYLSVKEYSGTYFEIPSEYPMHNTGPSNYAEKPTSIFYKDWIHLLFRDCIYLPNSMNNVPMVSEKVKYSIQMKTALPHSYILLINNDNGVTVRPSVDFPYTWLHLPENNMGYSLLGVAGSGPAPNGKWSLQILGPGIMGTERLPKPANASSQSLCSNFHILELEDYYEPNSSGLLFRRRICAINDSLITVQLRLSVPNVYTRLCIKMGNKEVVFDDGYGGACIFAYMLLSDTMSSDGRKSRASNSGRLLEASKTEVIKSSPREVTNPKLTAVKSNTARVSPRKSTTPKKNIKPGSGSSSSTGGSTVGSSGGSSGISSAHNERNSRPVSSEPISAQLQGDKENTLKDEDRYYWIEAFVDVKQWPLSISNWSFLEERRLAKLEECQVNNQSRSASADKSSSGRTVKSATKSAGGKSSGVGQKSGSGRGNSAKIDVNQAHWKIRIICNNSSDVKLINADSRTAEIKALKRAWEEVEPGRSMRGELSRTRYLEEYGLMNRPDLIDDTESVITAKSDDSQIQTAREQPLTDPSSDPSRIYVLTFPQELNRTVSHVKPVELQKFTMKPDEVELNRIDEASKLVGPNTEQWFIASHYLQQVQLLPNNDMDKMIKVKREIFNKLMHNLEMELADHKKKRGLCQQNHIVMLKIAQFLNDEAHFKYYDMCTTYRNNLIKQYKEEKEALLNESADYSAVEPLVSQQKSPKKERIKSSRSSKSGSKSRPSSIKRRS
uniref:Androglobin n=1 Tax=Trichobilharzia regenti TaxID=157069 RepID=A0AA85JCX2_TRIRE|nr:unnamed protein product [Trichobilharzia regenti]